MMTNKIQPVQKLSVLITLLALFFVLLINGAIPFFTVPTFGQALWTTGFAQSLANSATLSIHASDIGFPHPAAIAFGLSGVLPIAVLIKLGIYPSDAYSIVVASWLIISYLSCVGLSRAFKLDIYSSTVLSLLWTSQPIIWAHQDYSMLASGIALLSLYFFSSVKLFIFLGESLRARLLTAVLYMFACLISIFMDGYTFMMFAVGSSMIGACAFFMPVPRSRLIAFAYPLHLASFSAAYYLYTLYIGKVQFESTSMDFFRGWGADLYYFLVPTSGIHWLWDGLNLSVVRSEASLFGDATVWRTTFVLPMLVLGFLSWFLVKKKNVLLNAALILALFGFYMSLGPGLKINTEKHESISAEMPAEAAIVTTGSSLISESIPGFKNMRAAYRWTALGVFSLWLLLVIVLSAEQKKAHRKAILAAAVLVLISSLPHIQERLEASKLHRVGFANLHKDLIKPLQEDTKEGELIAFLPYRNDFIATYIAPVAGIKTYNIGGDKNLSMAKNYWPEAIKTLSVGRIDNRLVASTLELLVNNQADAVIFPHMDFEKDFNSWPAPIKFTAELSPIIERLKKSGLIEVSSRAHYSIARLRDDASLGQVTPEEMVRNICPSIYPVISGPESCALPFVLREGWYAIEERSVWSGGTATLRLYRPKSCLGEKCRISIKFSVYGASTNNPAYIHFQWSGRAGKENPIPSLSISSQIVEQVDLSLPTVAGYHDLFINIPGAISPEALSGSRDSRTLGVSLISMDVSD